MDDQAATDQDTRVCSRCGQSKPVSQFDRRFINKPFKIKCADCRVEVFREQGTRRAARSEEPPQHEFGELQNRRALIAEYCKQRDQYMVRALDWRDSLLA